MSEEARLWPYLRAGVLLGGWAMLKYCITLSYAMNPGRPVHFALQNNVEWLWKNPAHALLLALVAVPLLVSSRHLPPKFRDLLACLVPFLVIMALVGGVGELRVFLEIIPLIWMAMLIGVRNPTTSQSSKIS